MERCTAPGQVVFGHANGFPPESYNPFFESFFLKGWHFAAPLANADLVRHPNVLVTWNQLIWSEQQIEKCKDDHFRIAIGHSLGAILALATQQSVVNKPFDALVLIEPVFLPPLFYKWYLRLPVRLRQAITPLSRKANRRISNWNNEAEAVAYLMKRNFFAQIPEHIRRRVVQPMIRCTNDGCSLRISKEWESRIYSTLIDPYPLLGGLNVPCLILRGANSETISVKTWTYVQSRYPHICYREIPFGGHLLPFEQPAAAATFIMDFIQSQVHLNKKRP